MAHPVSAVTHLEMSVQNTDTESVDALTNNVNAISAIDIQTSNNAVSSSNQVSPSKVVMAPVNIEYCKESIKSMTADIEETDLIEDTCTQHIVTQNLIDALNVPPSEAIELSPKDYLHIDSFGEYIREDIQVTANSTPEQLFFTESSCTESPGTRSQAAGCDADEDSLGSTGDERITCIEEEHINRITVLEQRHIELEDVLIRLTAAIEHDLSASHLRCQTLHQQDAASSEPKVDPSECDKESNATGICTAEKYTVEASKNIPLMETDESNIDDAIERAEKNNKTSTNYLSHGLSINLFVEFQQKIRNFAQDLNGVLTCSEAAIRHARVVQAWAARVQLMFEQLKEERKTILKYVDERERNILVIREQFIEEIKEQGKQLQHIVDEMMTYSELKERAEKQIGDPPSKAKSVADGVVNMLLKKRLDENKAVILSLSKQSKISEMKLFIIHQQSCIQQLQEQNKELRAIIEGLMGTDDFDEEFSCDTDQSGTPASVSATPEHPVRDTVGKQDDMPINFVSEVLYCDKAEYLPGTSTDGDISTLITHGIGEGKDDVEKGGNILFDPLAVSYVREQCRWTEEIEQHVHAASGAISEDITEAKTCPKVEDIQEIQHSFATMNIEPDLMKSAVDRQFRIEQTAAGDGPDVIG